MTTSSHSQSATICSMRLASENGLKLGLSLEVIREPSTIQSALAAESDSNLIIINQNLSKLSNKMKLNRHKETKINNNSCQLIKFKLKLILGTDFSEDLTDNNLSRNYYTTVNYNIFQ